MPCRHIQIYFDDYLANTLDIEVKGLIDNHLKGCPACRDALAETRQLLTMLKSRPTFDPGDDYWQRVENTIISRTMGENYSVPDYPKPEDKGTLSLVIRYLVPLAASFILLFGSLFYLDQNPKSTAVMSRSDQSNSNSTTQTAAYSDYLLDSRIFTSIVIGPPGSPATNLASAGSLGGY